MKAVFAILALSVFFMAGGCQSNDDLYSGTLKSELRKCERVTGDPGWCARKQMERKIVWFFQGLGQPTAGFLPAISFIGGATCFVIGISLVAIGAHILGFPLMLSGVLLIILPYLLNTSNRFPENVLVAPVVVTETEFSDDFAV